MTTHITLIGYKSSGKSTIAKLYAEQYLCSYVDTDSLILKNERADSIYELYKTLGDKKFRDLELFSVANMVNGMSKKPHAIIAAGGGVALNKTNIINLKKISKIIYIDTALDTITARISSCTHRSFLTDSSLELGMNLEQRITKDYNNRKSVYVAASDYIINTDKKSNCEIVAQIRRIVTNKHCIDR